MSGIEIIWQAVAERDALLAENARLTARVAEAIDMVVRREREILALRSRVAELEAALHRIVKLPVADDIGVRRARIGMAVLGAQQSEIESRPLARLAAAKDKPP